MCRSTNVKVKHCAFTKLNFFFFNLQKSKIGICIIGNVILNAKV